MAAMVELSGWLSWLDMRTVLVFGVTLLSGILWTSSQRNRRKRNLPPGPMVWPLVGNLPQVIQLMRKYGSQYKMNQELSKIYGPVFTLKMGRKDVVMVTGYEEIKEVLQTNACDFVNRPSDKFFQVLNHGYGIVFSNGQKWEEIRKFTVGALRDFGVGKRSLEYIIQSEAGLVCEQMLSQKTPFHPKKFMTLAVSNMIFNIIFGDRYEYDDTVFHEILAKMNFITSAVGPAMIERYLPFVKYLPIDTTLKKVLRHRADLEKYTYKKIDEHRQTYDPNMARDYIDLYLKVCEEGHKYKTLNEPHLFYTIVDLYFAGAESTSTTLDWFILYMVVYPEVQQKIQKELDQVVGQGRTVLMEDRGSLPYTVAVLQELQRIINVVPMTAPHCAVKDTHLNGYSIPAKTMMLIQIMNVHIEYFSESMKFKPERWLDGNEIRKDEHFIPFGMGPRKCVGENLAKMELFVFATFFLQHYNFKLPAGQPKPTTEGIHIGITLQAQPYNVIIEPRS